MSRSRVVPLLLSLVFASAAALAATAGESGPDTTNRITLRLEPTTYNTGRIGRAVLVPVGEKTSMTIMVSGVPDYTTRPIHLYADLFEGSCAKRNPEPTYAHRGPGLAHSLIDPMAIGAFKGPSQIGRTLPVSFRELQATPFGVSVRLGPADGNAEIFCGDTGGRAAS